MFVLIVDIEAIPGPKQTQLHITDGDQDFPNGSCLLTHQGMLPLNSIPLLIEGQAHATISSCSNVHSLAYYACIMLPRPIILKALLA